MAKQLKVRGLKEREREKEGKKQLMRFYSCKQSEIQKAYKTTPYSVKS